MVRDARRLVQHIDLPGQDVFRFLEVVGRGLGRAGGDAVEAGGEVRGDGGGLGADSVRRVIRRG